MKSTNQHKEYWAKRKIDWNQAYTSTADHPHRELIIQVLKEFAFMSLFEMGCASGPNLLRIQKEWSGLLLGGIDINEDAIAEAKRVLPRHKSRFMVEDVTDPYMSDKSVDMILTDMVLIYVGKDKIDFTLSEIKRIARTGAVFCEFHHPSFLKRLGLKLTSGYNAHDYKKLLKKHGFWDIQIRKIPPEYWENGEPQKTYGYIISART